MLGSANHRDIEIGQSLAPQALRGRGQDANGTFRENDDLRAALGFFLDLDDQ